MITKIRIQNYRSFADAEVKLRPFSLVVGANGSGKSNLMKFLVVASQVTAKQQLARGNLHVFSHGWQKHCNFTDKEGGFRIDTPDAHYPTVDTGGFGVPALDHPIPWRVKHLPIFNLSPNQIAEAELVESNPVIQDDGSGTVQVLDSLKNGDREDLFDKIEESFKQYVPEVEKLSSRTVEQGKKQIQVREKGLKELLPATELSEGTRIILCLLTILHQENPPPIILLEDIDRGLHPRLFEYMVPIMRDIAERHGINILATTHNPYLVDCFQDDKEAVIIVEKKEGASTLTTLADRLKDIDYDSVDPEDLPLGSLWFTGHVGGVPAKINRRPEK
ncbi:MAG: AAA family ATPase [Verrucomicrobia bacterium]|nr:AAA family ATPase [Verrucomicrobiota bacterium]